jgi:hypothetical protein
VDGKKMVNGKLINSKHFIKLPNVDKDIILEKNIINSINNLPEVDERNIIVDHDPENEKKSDEILAQIDELTEDIASDTAFENEADKSILFLMAMRLRVNRVNT